MLRESGIWQLPEPMRREFHEVLPRLFVATDSEAAILEVLQTCVRVSAAQYGALFLHDPQTKTLRYHLSSGVSASLDQYLRNLEPWVIGQERGIVGKVAEDGTPVYLADVTADPRWTGRSDRICSAIWVPLRVGQQLFGVFNILSAGVDALSAEAQTFIIGMADYASLALERQRSQADLDRSLERERLLASITRQVEEMRDPEAISELGMTHALNISGVDAAVFFATERDGTSRFSRIIGKLPAAMIEHLQQDITPSGQGVVGRAVYTRQPAFVDDYSQDPNAEPYYVSLGLRTVALIPLLDHAQVVGVMALASIGRSVHLAPALQEWLQALAARIGNAYGEAHALREVKENREAALAVIGRAMELRDYETQGHTERVTSWAEQMVRQVSADPDFHRAIRWGALLHDVGKLAIADTILLKPGPLTPEERARIEQHPDLGAAVLAHMTFLPKETLDVVRHHHERWDGKGYPDRIAGADIPLGARLFAVVDTYDALVSVRPYKKAWSQEAAEAYLIGQAGQQFDPDMVQLFLRILHQEAGPTSDGG